MRALLPIAIMGMLGCTDGSPEVRIYTLEVTREDDGITALDMEIHVFDETGAHIACAGNDQGLEEVDASDIKYRLNAFFRRTDRNTRLTLDYVANRTLIFEVWEDDGRPCPTPPSAAADGDDHVGTSGPLAGDALDIGVLTFGNVNALELGYQ